MLFNCIIIARYIPIILDNLMCYNARHLQMKSADLETQEILVKFNENLHSYC